MRASGIAMVQLLQGGRRAVVVDEDRVEHRGVGSARADAAELVARDLDGLSIFPRLRGASRQSWLSFSARKLAKRYLDADTSVPIFSPRSARVTLVDSPIPNTRMATSLSWHSEKAAASTTLKPWEIACS